MVERLLRQQPQDYSMLYLDMDSFFASVEQQANPSLRGKPVAVCPCLSDSTSVIAASIEAKQYGIKTGTRVDEARRLCPQLILVSDSPVSYRAVWRQFMNILDDTPGRAVSRGIDEAYLVIPSYLRTHQSTIKLASDIKASIANQIGSYVGCSIGIAPNIWLAKMAASFDKPNGLVVLHHDKLSQFYSQLQLLDFNGINRRLAKRLYDLGIYNTLQFFATPHSLLKRAWGVNGEKWYLRLRGYEVDRQPPARRQSFSHQVTLPPAVRLDRLVWRAILIKICYRLAYRLRRAGLKSQSLVLTLVFTDWSYVSRLIRLGRATSAGSELATPHLVQLLAELARPLPLRKLAITVFDLTTSQQLALNGFDGQRAEAVGQALDVINGNYGPDTIMPARALDRSLVPDRIGFGNTEGV